MAEEMPENIKQPTCKIILKNEDQEKSKQNRKNKKNTTVLNKGS